MKVVSDEAMAAHVSWRAGGRVAIACFPDNLDDLADFMPRLRRDEPLLMVGLGSNLLIRDGGFDGAAVFTHGALNTLRLDDDGLIYAEAGVAAPRLARFAALHNLVGAEFLAGVPGTIGGALAMNAGCHGDDIWSCVAEATMLNRDGELVQRPPEDFAIAYRRVGLRCSGDEVFVAARLRFAAGDGASARARMKALLQKRAATQPLRLPNAGSVFRNPANDYAARLIEAAGLKGLVHEGAQVSEKHANFVVNPGGGASASAIESLIERIQVEVFEQFGVRLQREVRILGTSN